MGAAQFGYFVGSFAMSLLFAAVWLIISKVIPSLRPRLRFPYGIAVVLAFLPLLITVRGLTASNLLAALLCAVLLSWQYKEAEGSWAPSLIQQNLKGKPDMPNRDELKEWIESTCPLFWSFLNKKAQTDLPKYLIEYIGTGTPEKIETGRDNLVILESYLTAIKSLCGLKTVGDTYRKGLSRINLPGIDSENKFAELFCEIALCAYLGNLSGKIQLRPPTGKGTYSDCCFNLHGLDIFAEVKRYVDPWPYIETPGDGIKEDVPYSRSITQSLSGEKPHDSARPRSMDLKSKLRDVYRKFPGGTLNILFVFLYLSPEPVRYLRQALFGESSFFKNEGEPVLESDGLFYLEEWRDISACYLARFYRESGVIFPFMWKNPRARLEIPRPVMEALGRQQELVTNESGEMGETEA